MKYLFTIAILVLTISVCSCEELNEPQSMDEHPIDLYTTEVNSYTEKADSHVEEADPYANEMVVALLERDDLIEYGLVLGKYNLVGYVVKSSYATDSFYEPERLDGYNTGQKIDVFIIEEIQREDRNPRSGEVIEGIFSGGGDTVIVGKPHAGDFVGHRDGEYASIWEKIDLLDIPD